MAEVAAAALWCEICSALCWHGNLTWGWGKNVVDITNFWHSTVQTAWKGRTLMKKKREPWRRRMGKFELFFGGVLFCLKVLPFFKWKHVNLLTWRWLGEKRVWLFNPQELETRTYEQNYSFLFLNYPSHYSLVNVKASELSSQPKQQRERKNLFALRALT